MQSTLLNKLEDVRDRIMRMELSDVGWDLRDELLDLRDVLASVVVAVEELQDRAKETTHAH